MTMTLTAPPARLDLTKIALAAVLVTVAELVIFDRPIGSVFGAFSLAWAIGVLALTPSLWRSRSALIAVACAIGFALVQIDRPSPLSVLLFWLSLTLAVLAPRAEGFDDAWRWAQRLVVHGLISSVGPALDLVGGYRRLPPGQTRQMIGRAPVLILPVVGGMVFLSLFSMANPIISEVLAAVRIPPPDMGRIVFGVIVLIGVWSTLSPRIAKPFLTSSMGLSAGVGLSTATVVLSLAVFNAVFALQNGLDLAFLWSGAPLPSGVSLADYAHRGAYTLIATAVLAGLFVIIALSPSAPTAQVRAVRVLLTVWIAQNLLLVASSVLRTVDYIEVYSLTGLRIAALAWMGLVAIGLVLIGWRMLRDKSGAWLINANALATAVVLAVSSLVDYGALAASWNVRHAREIDGSGAALDVCYLQRVGAPALISLVELQSRPLPPALKETAASARDHIVHDMRERQASGYGWTFRDARRLAKAEALNGGPDFPAPLDRQSCEYVDPAPPASPPKAPLTNPA